MESPQERADRVLREIREGQLPRVDEIECVSIDLEEGLAEPKAPQLHTVLGHLHKALDIIEWDWPDE